MKKVVSIVLSIVMLMSVLSVSAAAVTSYSVSGTAIITVAEGYKLDKDHYSINYNFAGSAYGTEVGSSDDFICAETSVTVTTPNVTTPVSINDDAFFSTIDGTGAEIKVDFSIVFENAEKAFGYINTNCKIGGFYDSDKELTETTKFKSFNKTETVNLLSVTGISLNDEVPATYKDSEKADLAGVNLSLTLSDGSSITYTPEANNSLAVCDPAVLTVDTSVVDIYFCGLLVKDDFSITVNHDFPAEFSSIGATHHAVVCKGCGAIDETTIAEHTFDNWTANDDASFLRDATETGTCTVCGATSTRAIADTAGYNQYKDMTFLYVIFDYIHLLLDTIYGSIKR